MIPETEDAETGVHVIPPSVERARMFVASVLLPATQTPLEYPIELHTAKGALTVGAVLATTDHAPPVVVVALGSDDLAKTLLLPAPPTIQSGAPAPCDPARPYATVIVLPATAPGNGVNMG
jgi:hypothetical protein